MNKWMYTMHIYIYIYSNVVLEYYNIRKTEGKTSLHAEVQKSTVY